MLVLVLWRTVGIAHAFLSTSPSIPVHRKNTMESPFTYAHLHVPSASRITGDNFRPQTIHATALQLLPSTMVLPLTTSSISRPTRTVPTIEGSPILQVTALRDPSHDTPRRWRTRMAAWFRPLRTVLRAPRRRKLGTILLTGLWFWARGCTGPPPAVAAAAHSMPSSRVAPSRQTRTRHGSTAANPSRKAGTAPGAAPRHTVASRRGTRWLVATGTGTVLAATGYAVTERRHRAKEQFRQDHPDQPELYDQREEIVGDELVYTKVTTRSQQDEEKALVTTRKLVREQARKMVQNVLHEQEQREKKGTANRGGNVPRAWQEETERRRTRPADDLPPALRDTGATKSNSDTPLAWRQRVEQILKPPSPPKPVVPQLDNITPFVGGAPPSRTGINGDYDASGMMMSEIDYGDIEPPPAVSNSDAPQAWKQKGRQTIDDIIDEEDTNSDAPQAWTESTGATSTDNTNRDAPSAWSNAPPRPSVDNALSKRENLPPRRSIEEVLGVDDSLPDPAASMIPTGNQPNLEGILSSDKSDSDAPLMWREGGVAGNTNEALPPADGDTPLLWREEAQRQRREGRPQRYPWEGPPPPENAKSVVTDGLAYPEPDAQPSRDPDPIAEESEAENELAAFEEEPVVMEELSVTDESAFAEAPPLLEYEPPRVTMDDLETEIHVAESKREETSSELVSQVETAAPKEAEVPELESVTKVEDLLEDQGATADVVDFVDPDNKTNRSDPAKSDRKKQKMNQPKTKEEEEELQRKYAAAPTLEDKAFQILKDLGMLEDISEENESEDKST
jgi:hypothetical protein